MKKFHLIMASILASATILGANALAADGYITNADPNEVTLVASEDNTSARIILAEYDDDGRLKAAKTTDVTLNSGETIYNYLDLGFYDTVADGTKIMLWSDDLSKPAPL